MSSYDTDIDPSDGEVIFSLLSPSGIENEIRALTIGGCPLYYATVRTCEYDKDGLVLCYDVKVCHHGEGMYVWDDLNTAIDTIKKWR